MSERIIIIRCRPWEGYIQSLIDDTEREMREYELQCDVEHEAFLARAHAYSEDAEFNTLWESYEYQEACEAASCPWPWYADEPTKDVDFDG